MITRLGTGWAIMVLCKKTFWISKIQDYSFHNFPYFFPQIPTTIKFVISYEC